MAVSPLPRPEADTPAYLLMSAMLSCPVCLLSGQKRRKQTFKTPAPARANPVSGTIPLRREIRNLKQKGPFGWVRVWVLFGWLWAGKEA